MTLVTPMRFVSGVLGLWIAGRVLVLVPGLMSGPASADAPAVARAAARLPLAVSVAKPAFPAPADTPDVALDAGLRRKPVVIATPSDGRRAGQAGHSGQSLPADPLGGGPPPPPFGVNEAAVRLAAIDPSPSPVGIVAAPPAAVPTASRWSGNLYLYRRGDGDTALATGGQLGGSQAGARIAYRLNAAGPARFAAAARLSSPLDDRHGAEAAAGLDWHPLPGQPLRLSVERRFDIGGAARNAWSAYAAGGFWREPRPGLVIDGYAQAGVVGARRRDLFADGAVRAAARRDLDGGRTLTVGAGVWGAAQPRVERIDLGPRIALGLPLAGTTVTAAAEWRIRAAGNASPRSGLALTLASDF